MNYISTRGKSEPRTFIQVVLEGLARDGGLFVPQVLPDFSSQLEQLKHLNYQDLAERIFAPFVDGEISDTELKELIHKSYQSFRNPEVTPLRFTDDVAILELYHGPTLAFKDVALQFLGNLFSHILTARNSELNILGATSGDTGSAAIYGVRGKKNINIFMLHPKGKISQIQEKQMTTVLDDNVFNIAVAGTFDDAQRIVKEIFSDLDFRDRYSLGAVNSINWARVMAQIVYYFYGAFRFWEQYGEKEVVFSVPTGNFGDIYAGYLARKMGLPVEKLILATNENDILFRALTSGQYKITEVHSTLSPSMDIQIASNFERFIFDLVDHDGNEVSKRMKQLGETGQFSLTDQEKEMAASAFYPVRVDTHETLAVIKDYKRHGIVLDPHTAVGIAAVEKSPYKKVITLATAHPCKFGDAVLKATGEHPELPQVLDGILEKKTRCLVAENSYEAVEQLIRDNLKD